MILVEKIFGTHSEREIKRIRKTVNKIMNLQPKMAVLTDEELQHKTVEFKERLNKGETLDELLPEAFAAVREADKRVLEWSRLKCRLSVESFFTRDVLRK